jgi:hypothetical protein
MAMQYPYKFQKIKLKRILGYPIRGIACALSILKHKQYPFDNVDEKKLAHVVC